MKVAVMLAFAIFLVVSVIFSCSDAHSHDDLAKSTPVFRDANGMYTVKVEVGTPGQELTLVLTHLRKPVIVSKACGQQCDGRTLYDKLLSSTVSTTPVVTNMITLYGNFTATEELTDKIKIAGKTIDSTTWDLANSANFPWGTNYAGLLPVTGSAGGISLEMIADQTASKTFAINFAKVSQNEGSGRLWMGTKDSSVAEDSIVYFDVLKFQGFSMLKFAEGQLGETTLNCRLGPKTDCDATLNLASNFSTLGRNLDSIASSLGLTKRSNKYVVDCNAVNSLPNLSLKTNNKQLTFTPQQYVVRNQVAGTEECLFGFVSSTLKDFRLGLNLIRHLYLTYRETEIDGNRKLQYGFYNGN